MEDKISPTIKPTILPAKREANQYPQTFNPSNNPINAKTINGTKNQGFGDWKIDTIVDPENKGAILTATERTTGFLLMKKLPEGKNTKALAKELFFLLLPYKNCVHSITSDNGTEFYKHKLIAKKPDADFFFVHPYSS